METPRWYALRTRSRHEKRVWAQIDRQGIEVFLPLIGRRSRWKDRTVQVQFPLFPGYCFAHFAWQDRLRVLTAPGVVEVLGAGGCGVPVAVRRGLFQGLRGIMVRKANRARLIIAVSLIRQGASVEIDADDVIPV